MAKRPPNWEIPDLDLALEPVSHPRPAGQGSSATSQALRQIELEPVGSAGGTTPIQGTFDPLDDELDLGISLGLADDDAPLAPSLTASATSTRECWPHLRPILPDQFAPTTDEIESQRPWGAPPQHLFETIAYAFWVYRGQRALERSIAQQRLLMAQTEELRRQVALEWFEQHRGELANNPRYASEYHGLERVTAELESKNQAYGQFAQSVENGQRQAEQELTLCRERIRGKRAEQQSLLEGHREASCDLNREQAKRQRLDIELRSGHLSPTAHAEAAAKVDAVIVTVQERLTNLAVESRTVEARIVADELSLRSQEDELRRQQRKKQGEQQAAQEVLSQALGTATVAKMELMSRLLILRDAELFAPSVRAQWLARELDLQQAARGLSCLLAAKDSFDRDKVRQGLWLLLFGLLLLFVPLLRLIFF